MTKTINKKVIAIAAAVVVLAVTLSLALVGCSSPKDAPRPDNDFAAETVNTQYVKLAMSSAATVAADNSVSKTLTATVLPATAQNKAVDWSAEWGDSSNTSNVSEYVTVTPNSDGSTTATVTCYKAFTGTVVITATTRENGYSATCIVTFVGLPTDISISGSLSPTSGAYKAGIGQSYAFDVSLSNPFNSVGSQFNSISCGVNGVGSMILGYMEHYNASGNDKWYDSSDKTVTLDSLKDNFITVSYSQGKLSITTIKSIESYYASVQRMDGGRTRAYTDKFRSYVDDCYFKVWITESTSGLTKEFIVRFDDKVVTGVNVSESEMSF